MERIVKVAYSVLFLFSALFFAFSDDFDCPKLPPLTKPAANVYELRPQDIKVAMALGDSVTAGIGEPNSTDMILFIYLLIY